jgi:hypothetical protein
MLLDGMRRIKIHTTKKGKYFLVDLSVDGKRAI